MSDIKQLTSCTTEIAFIRAQSIDSSEQEAQRMAYSGWCGVIDERFQANEETVIRAGEGGHLSAGCRVGEYGTDIG